MSAARSGQGIVILGAAGFLGRATSRHLAGLGHSCFLIDRDESTLSDSAQAADGTSLPCAVADVTSTMSLAVARDHAVRTLGRIDSVVLAFGAEGPIGLLEDLDEESFDRVMAVNAKGVFVALKTFLPVLKTQRSGSIVVLASISGTIAAPLMTAYAASKHAALGLVRTAAREAGEFGIRVNAICPGPVRSEMMERIDDAVAAHDGQARAGERSAGSIPLKRYATADDVVRMVAFLCSDDSRYSTGSTFMLDGGYTCR